MSTIYDLRAPQGHGSCNYVELENIAGDAIFRIGGLSGCMGVICYLKEHGPTNCLMAHDSSDRYAVAKREVTKFFSKHHSSIANIKVYWCAKNNIGQNNFFLSAGIDGKNIRKQPYREDGTQIWLPFENDDYNDPINSNHAPFELECKSEAHGERPVFTSKGNGNKSTWAVKEDGVKCCYCNQRISPKSEVHRCRMCGQCVHAPLGRRKCSDFYIMGSCGVKSLPWPFRRGERFCQTCIDSVILGGWGNYISI